MRSRDRGQRPAVTTQTMWASRTVATGSRCNHRTHGPSLRRVHGHTRGRQPRRRRPGRRRRSPPSDMQRIAKEVGYSESAFVTRRARRRVRRALLQPARPRCRSAGMRRSRPAVALADRDGAGTLDFHTKAGTGAGRDQRRTAPTTATLTSVVPHVEDAAATSCSTSALDALHWTQDDLDPQLPPKIALRRRAPPDPRRAHPRARLADLDYDFDALKQLMLAPRPDDGRPRPPRRRARPSTRATRSPSAAWSRTPPRARRPPRSVPYLKELKHLTGTDHHPPGRRPGAPERVRPSRSTPRAPRSKSAAAQWRS